MSTSRNQRPLITAQGSSRPARVQLRPRISQSVEPGAPGRVAGVERAVAQGAPDTGRTRTQAAAVRRLSGRTPSRPGHRAIRTGGRALPPEILADRRLSAIMAPRPGAQCAVRRRSDDAVRRRNCGNRLRGEKQERRFAHLPETGGLRRVSVRGQDYILKRMLLHAAAYNLGLLMLARHGVGCSNSGCSWVAALQTLYFHKSRQGPASLGRRKPKCLR